MGKRRGVSIVVDEDFFRRFEKERQKEQTKLRQKFGGIFNLSQRNFTAILAKKSFIFRFPKQEFLKSIKRRRIK